jgi:hypothetical protein
MSKTQCLCVFMFSGMLHYHDPQTVGRNPSVDMGRNSGLLSSAWSLFLSFQLVQSSRNTGDALPSQIPRCARRPSWRNYPPAHAAPSARRLGFADPPPRAEPQHAERRPGSKHPRTVEDISPARPTEEWLHRYLSLSAAQQRAFYSRFPDGVGGIRRLGRRRLHAWLKFFLSDDGAGLDHAQLKKMVLSRPRLLSYALSNVRSTTAYFREELGLSSGEYASMLRSYPSVLMHGVDTRLRPTVDFLQNECGGGKDNWASWKRVVYSYPSIFSYSTERTLSPTLTFLCGNDTGNNRSLGLSRSELSQVVSKFPPTLWLGEDNLRCKLDFLVESLGLEGSDLRTIIVSYPQVLGLSLQNNLKPKVDFFLDAEESGGDFSEIRSPLRCGLSKDQLREFVLYQPALLAYSLEKRLRPRIARMQEKNISL